MMALDKNDIAKRIAKEVKDKYFVNLGIGNSNFKSPIMFAMIFQWNFKVKMECMGMGPLPFEGEGEVPI